MSERESVRPMHELTYASKRSRPRLEQSLVNIVSHVVRVQAIAAIVRIHAHPRQHRLVENVARRDLLSVWQLDMSESSMPAS